MVVDGDPLVGERLDPRDFGGERRVEQVPEAQSLPFGDDANYFGIGREVERRDGGGRPVVLGVCGTTMTASPWDTSTLTSLPSLGIVATAARPGLTSPLPVACVFASQAGGAS